MASSHPFLLSASLSLVCFFFVFLSFDNKSFASAIREQSTGLQHTHHVVPLTSLFPSSSCTSPSQGASRKGSLELVHKHGPCSKLKQDTLSSLKIPHNEILKQDEARVRSTQSKLREGRSHPKEVERSTEELDQTPAEAELPAQSGIPLGTANYVVTVGLGTPTTELSLAFDTGSDLTWTQCQPCQVSCYPQQDPIFDPSQSSSYANFSCSSSFCSQPFSGVGMCSSPPLTIDVVNC